MKNFDNHIKHHINNLPQVKVDSNRMWSEVESHLDLEDKIIPLVHKLPERGVNAETLWQEIEADLNNVNKDNERKLIPNWNYFSAMAAAIVLLAIFLWNKKQAPDKIEFSVEQIAVEEYTLSTISTTENDAFAFISASCEMKQLVCDTDEFKVLKLQLDELTNEIDKINSELAANGNDPYLMKAQIKVENLRSDVAQKLVTILVS